MMKPTYDGLVELLKRVREEILEYNDERAWCLYPLCDARWDRDNILHDETCLWRIIDNALEAVDCPSTTLAPK